MERVTRLVTIAPDVARLVGCLLRDRRVPVAARVFLLAAAAFFVLPSRKLLPGRGTQTGLLVDGALVAWALSRLITSAGYDVVREHWTGSDEDFALLVLTVGMAR